jgi:uncharacterized protein (TIGR02300 family)
MGTDRPRHSKYPSRRAAQPGGGYRTTRGINVAKPELGTKRIDPETGRKFYDLNKDPIVSPYTGKSYPRSFFETADGSVQEEEEVEEKELDAEEDVETVSLEEADDEASGGAEEDIDIEDDDVDLGEDDDETFLEDEEEDDDVSGMIDVDDDEDEH